MLSVLVSDFEPRVSLTGKRYTRHLGEIDREGMPEYGTDCPLTKHLELGLMKDRVTSSRAALSNRRQTNAPSNSHRNKCLPSKSVLFL